jgi:cell division protein FtsZ
MKVTVIATGFDQEERILFPEMDIPAIYRLGLGDMTNA